jgi:ABC-type uncharacterized transport system permease subunit
VAPLPPVLTVAVGVLTATVVVLLLGHDFLEKVRPFFFGVLHNPLLNV